ncbi:bifunctional metallophosphatase/5'-nucleotidase [Bacillus niameyensis]|uniref:bifunctional metallophosphatase/5'-nucleotidase n=1 Tax=Bacillus niameyensis TaxID=1522308 RepID=UPI000781298F|nr:bifunctional UDP-sugar hydrolase/5'-nucleotidase [Bacillus niameyensis]
MKETIYIYHTNDFHSHFENWPKIEAFLKEKKSYHEAAKEDVFIFDCGDFTDRFHPFTEGTMGKGNTKLLNETGYTAATIGNNEGITLPHEDLAVLYEDAQFDLIVANLYTLENEHPNWLQPYKIYETKLGTRIGVTAVTTYYQKLYELLGWHVSEPFTELEIQLNRMKEQVDMIIVLSHLGIHEDEKMTKLFPQIDLIIGAHTHHFFPEGKKLGKTMMAAAGKYGQLIGQVQVEIHQRKVSHIQPSLVQTSDLPYLPNEAARVHHFKKTGKEQLNTKIAEINKVLSYSWEKPSELSQLLCDAVHEWSNAECTIINSGLVLSELQAGRVTKYDLHKMLPHPINPCMVELSGAELKEIILHATEDGWSDFAVKGLGFRGKVMGIFVFRGIELDKAQLQVKINGQLLDPERLYKLGTVDMFTFGKFFPEIQRSPKKQYFMPEFLRDIMEWKLKQVYLS